MYIVYFYLQKQKIIYVRCNRLNVIQHSYLHIRMQGLSDLELVQSASKQRNLSVNKKMNIV